MSTKGWGKAFPQRNQLPSTMCGNPEDPLGCLLHETTPPSWYPAFSININITPKANTSIQYEAFLYFELKLCYRKFLLYMVHEWRRFLLKTLTEKETVWSTSKDEVLQTWSSLNVPGVKGDKMLKQTHNTWEVNCSSQVYKNRPIIFDVWYTSYVYNIMLKAQISPLEKSLIC